MGDHYEKDIMRQLQEVMERLDKTEQEVKDTRKSRKKEVKELKTEFAAKRKELNDKIKRLKTELNYVKAENKEFKEKVRTLENENSRLRSQLNNDSTNSSLPPSTDQKGKKLNQYNSREKRKKHKGSQEGHKGVTLKVDIMKKVAEGKLKREIVDIGEPSKKYTVRYKIDYRITPIVTEMQFHEDETGKIHIETFYNAVRPHASIGYLTPNAYEERINSIYAAKAA